jgi:tRNA nucleotidyltransferase/poly(A) polymerase
MKKNSNEELYKIFNAAGNRVFETAIILSFIKGKNIKRVFKKADEFLKIKNKILLNGNDVQKILNIKPGTNIGKILSALKEQHFKGLIKTKAEARRWLVLNFT